MASGTGPVSYSKDKPTILIIQGCFQRPVVYDALKHRLESLGYPIVLPSLPTCGDAEDPNFPSLTLLNDAEAVREKLELLVERERKTVMIVMHSYGGLVGSEAIPESMSHIKRRKDGLLGGVIHLFFISAFLLDPGQSVLGVFGVSPNDKMEVNVPFVQTSIVLMCFCSLAGWPLYYQERLIRLIQRPSILRSKRMGETTYPALIRGSTDRAHKRCVQFHTLYLSHLRE